MEALWEQRSLNALRLDEINRRRMAIESLEARMLPDSYGTRRFSGDLSETFFEIPPLSRVLDRPVTINLQGANLGAFIETLAQDEVINMIADQGLAADKEISIAVSDVPLREVLDFIARNYDVRSHRARRKLDTCSTLIHAVFGVATLVIGLIF